MDCAKCITQIQKRRYIPWKLSKRRVCKHPLRWDLHKATEVVFAFVNFSKSVTVCPGPTANLCHALEPLMVDVGVILFPKRPEVSARDHAQNSSQLKRTTSDPQTLVRSWSSPSVANRAQCHAMRSPSSQSVAVNSSHAMLASRAYSFHLQVQQDGLGTRPNHRPLDN